MVCRSSYSQSLNSNQYSHGLQATASLLFDVPEFMALLTGQQPEELSGSTSAAAASTLAQASNESQSNLRAARIAQVGFEICMGVGIWIYAVFMQASSDSQPVVPEGCINCTLGCGAWSLICLARENECQVMQAPDESQYNLRGC